jgi:hypothetical protein
MASRLLKPGGIVLAASALFCSSAMAAGPPPPKSTNGNTVQLVGSGLSTPTSFAFGAGQTFVSDFGSEDGKSVGGVFVLKGGAAVRLPGSPPISFGLAWHKNTLYISALNRLMAWSGWNGSEFTSRKVIYTAPKRFTGFNGIGFGANGRLYVGVSLADTNDHGPPKTPYAYDILSLTAKGKDLKIVAQGIRQPWQMVFPAGSSSPFVSGLGQDKGAKNPPDFVFRIKSGQDYGFPKCNWTKASACKGFARPFKMFSPHFDAMGLGLIGAKLYISSFLGPKGTGPGGQVFWMPRKGGAPKPLLTGFVAPVVALGTHSGWVYAGEVGTGLVHRVKA